MPEDYAYTNIDNAPNTHREICALMAANMSRDEIVADLGLDRDMVARVMAYSVVQNHAEYLRARFSAANAKLVGEFRGEDSLPALAMKAVRRALSRYVDDTIPAKEKPATKDALKAAEIVMDRDPSRQFVKTSRQEIAKQVTVVDSEAIRALKDQAHRLGVVNAEFREVDRPALEAPDEPSTEPQMAELV